MDGMSNTRKEIMGRLGSIAGGARPGAKVRMGKNLQDLEVSELERFLDAYRIKGYDINQSSGVVRVMKQDVQRAKNAIAHLNQMIRKEGVGGSVIVDVVSFSRPGAKAQFGFFDGLGARLKTAIGVVAGPQKSKTPEQYKEGLEAAKQACASEVGNYKVVLEQHTAQIRKLTEYVNKMNRAAQGMNSAPEVAAIARKIHGAMQTLNALRMATRLPFSRTGKKAAFASKNVLAETRKAFASLTRQKDKLETDSTNVLNSLDDLARKVGKRKSDIANKFRALEQKWGKELDDIQGFSTEELPSEDYDRPPEAALIGQALRECAQYSVRVQQIKNEIKLFKNEYEKALKQSKGKNSRRGAKLVFADGGCGTGAGGFKPGNTCGAEEGGGKAAKPKAGGKGKPKAERKGKKGEKKEKPKETERRGVDFDDYSDMLEEVRKTRRMAADILSDDPEQAEALDREADYLEEEARSIAREYRMEDADRDEFCAECEEHKKSMSVAANADQGTEADAARHMAADAEAEDIKMGDKIKMATDPAVGRKIAKLMDEGYPQKQAIAIALDMKRRGEI